MVRICYSEIPFTIHIDQEAVANGSTWNQVAGQLARNMTNTPFQKAYNNSIRIARTEGHRIQIQSALDAMYVAKSKGADVVKQWDSTLDGRIRPTHRELDGKLAEVEEKFKYSGGEVLAPMMFGNPAEDCNCRCALLQRARWALDEEELQTLKERAEYFGLDKTEDFYEFQNKYMKITVEVVDNFDSAPKTDFTPALTIEETEKYAKRFIEGGYSPTFRGEAVFKGISLEHANEINRALEELYERYDMPKLKGIKVISPTSAQGKKVFSSGDAVAAYNPVEHGIFINKKILKDAKALKAYNKEAEEAWNIVMKNMDKLTGKQLELAETYKRAGRQIVGDGSVRDYIIHEMGHHIQWTVLDAKTNNLIGDRMSRYAPHISGYANASKGEYIAESFAAYMKGEKKILDPEFVKYLDDNGIIKGRESVAPSNNSVTIRFGADYSRRGTGVLKTIQLPKKEYAHVMSEFNTHMSDNDRKKPIVSKPIGDYIYTIENNGFDNYRIIGKVPIDKDYL